MPWLPRSLDFTPLNFYSLRYEFMRNRMVRGLFNLHHPPKTPAQLIHEVQIACKEMSQKKSDFKRALDKCHEKNVNIKKCTNMFPK